MPTNEGEKMPTILWGEKSAGWGVMSIIIVSNIVWSVTRVSHSFSLSFLAFCIIVVLIKVMGQLTGCLAATAALGYMLSGLD